METITVICDDNLSDDARHDSPLRGVNLSPDSAKKVVKNIDVEKLGASMESLSANLGKLLQNIKKTDGFSLKEAKVQLTISAEGGIVLIGKAGVKGAITLKFAVDP